MESKINFPWGRLIKTVIVAAIAVSMVMGNFVVESRFLSKNEVTTKFKDFDYTKENILPENGVIRFDSATSKVENILVDNNLKQYVFKMLSGRMWGNFFASSAKVNILLADKVVLIPNNAEFDLTFDEKEINLSVFNGDVYIGFLKEGIDTKKFSYVDEYSELFINQLLVPKDTQSRISLSKLDDRIKQLFYLKLVKELKYSTISADKKESQWVKDNLAKDQEMLQSLKRSYSSKILKQSIKVKDDFRNKIYFQLEENLTLFPQQNKQMKLKHLLSFLDDAVYFAEENNSEVSKTRLDDFSAYYLTLPSELMDDLDLRKLLSDYIYQLSIFDSGDKVYEVSKSLRDREFSSGDKLATVKMFWLDAYKATNLGNFKVEEAISNYYGYLQQIFKAKENIKNYKKFVIYQNQLIDNLLLKYPMFYREGYFSIKNSLEKELISLYAAGQAREELIRELINNKITFLQRLRYFFFKDEVEVTDAKNVMSRLIEEIDLLMDAQSSKVAVQTLFEAEMEDIGNLWGYLNTPEYYSSKSYGATHEDRYKAYVAEKAKIWSFVDVQRDVLGEEAAPEITKADVVKEIEEKFVEYAEITNVKVVNLEDPTSRFVDIEAVVGGYPFTATYDREYGTLKQVKSYDELIAKDSLKISGLLTLVQEKLQGREDLAVPEEFNEETNAERVARVYIVTKLNEAGFEASLANVEVINKDEYWYRVSDVYIKDNESTKASFDYIANSEKAKNLYLLMDKKPILVDGEYSLEEVKGVILGEKEYEVKKVGRTKAS